MFKIFPVNIVTLDCQECCHFFPSFFCKSFIYSGFKPFATTFFQSVVCLFNFLMISFNLSSSWGSIKYCFRHLFAKKYFELDIFYSWMLEKFIITVFDPLVEFSRYSLLNLGRGLILLAVFRCCSYSKMVLTNGNTQSNLVFSCLLLI